MSFEVETNIEQLLKTIRSDVQGMFSSAELENAGRKAYDIMYKNVRNRMKTTGYNYSQSGSFLEAMDDEAKGFDKNNRTKSSMTVGFGYIGDGQEGLNDPMFMRQEQVGVFVADQGYNAGQRIVLSLKAETQMPKWIPLEFGTRDYAEEIPSQFRIGYTKRPDKEVMFGPSISPPSGLSKNIYAMISEQQHAKLGNGNWYSSGDERDMSHNRHRGNKAGRFFQNGLEDSKLPIYEEIGKGIEEYFKRISGGG